MTRMNWLASATRVMADAPIRAIVAAFTAGDIGAPEPRANAATFWRTRADDRHLAPEDVVELGQFVQAELAEEAADTGDARIVFDLEDRAAGLIEVL